MTIHLELYDSGVIFGLLAAVGWGASATMAAMALRRAQPYIVVLLSQALGVIMLAVLAITMHPSLARITGSVAIGLAWAGLVGLIGYLFFYQAVSLGPAGLMSAISSTYGGVAAGLAVGLLGEHLAAVGIAGVLLAITGIALAAATPTTAAASQIDASQIDVDQKDADQVAAAAHPVMPIRRTPLAPAAIPFAFGSAIAYGVSGFLLADYSRRSGWLLSGVIAHGTSVVLLMAVLPLVRGRMTWRLGGRTLGWIAAAGIADAMGLIAYSRGTQIGQVAITAAASSIYPVIPLVVGVALLGERLSRSQLLGTVLIIAGLVLLGLT